MDQQSFYDALDPELLERVSARRRAIAQAGKLGLALASAPVAFGLMARSAFGQALPQQVKDALNFALTLEYLEDEFYRLGLAAAGLIPPADRPIFAQISKHEAAHVALLKGVLGADAVAKPTFDFTGGNGSGTGPFNAFGNYPTFQALAQGFEDTGVRAYKGQAAAVMVSDTVLTVALQIHSVEARHAAEVRKLRGLKETITGNQNDVPPLQPVYNGEENTTQGGVNVATLTNRPASAATESFDEILTMAQVLAIADPFIAG